MRKCQKCKEVKSLSEFYKSSCWKDGYDSRCKECSKAARRNSWNGIVSIHKIRHERNINSKEFWCPRCKEYKDRGEFYYSTKYNKYSAWCVPCDRQYQKSKRKTPEYKLLRAKLDHERRQLVSKSEMTLTSDEIRFLLHFQENSCACCHRQFSSNLKYELDHIVPVSKGGGLALDNVQLLCKSCNCSKKDKTIQYRLTISQL